MKQISAVGYGRTSVEDSSGEKVSCDVQKLAFEQACIDHGWTNAGWFEDRDVSGRAYPVGAPVAQFDTITRDYLLSKTKTKQTRQGLAKALTVGANIIWVRDITRFARPLSGSMLAPYLRGVLQERNLTLWTGDNGEVDYTNFETKLVRSIQDEIEDNSIKTKTAQSKASRDNKRDAGLIYVDPYSLGFRSCGHGKVQAIPEELETVKQAFNLSLEGKTPSGICVIFNKQGVRSLTGVPWSRRSVLLILRRPWYAGYQWNSAEDTLIENKEFMKHAIITKSQFLQAQARLDKTATGVKRENKYAHPLSGLLFCGCGKSMIPYAISQDLRYYKCQHHLMPNNDTNCKVMIRETLGVPALIGQPKGFLSKEPKDENYAGLLEALYPFTIPAYIRQLKAKDTTPDLLDRQVEVRNRIEDLKNKAVTRYQDMEAGILPKSVFAELMKQRKRLNFDRLDGCKVTRCVMPAPVRPATWPG